MYQQREPDADGSAGAHIGENLGELHLLQQMETAAIMNASEVFGSLICSQEPQKYLLMPVSLSVQFDNYVFDTFARRKEGTDHC
jgi:hypothetical protein